MSKVTQLRPKPALRLHCSTCGATTEAACDRGVGSMSAGEFAAKAAAERSPKWLAWARIQFAGLSS
jgi:hypothetical protein